MQDDKPFKGDNVKFVGTAEFTSKTNRTGTKTTGSPVEKEIPAKIVLTNGDLPKELEITYWEKKIR